MQWADRIGRRLKPRDLHVFLAVAEHGNMAKAAERLAISRPVVSKTITSLEGILGIRLFDRTAQGVEPTLYGRALVRRTLAVFDELKQSVQEIEYLADPTAGEVRIACTEVMSAGLVSVTVDRLLRRHPQWVFHLQLANAAAHLELLRSRACEVVVGRPEMPQSPPDVETERLFFEKLRVVAGPRSKWSSRSKITLADLVDAPWIQARLEMERGGPTFEAFKAAGLGAPHVCIFSESLNLRYRLLEAGPYITMIPESALRLGPKRALKVLSVDIPRWRQATAISVLRGRTLSPIARAFIDGIREVAKTLPAAGRCDTPGAC